MSVRFLHIADLHLGSQLSTRHRMASGTADVLDSAVYTAVERLFDLALEEDVDFVIIAGDLYDKDARSVRANTFLKEQFDRFADEDIPAYVTYGNHDPVGAATTYVDLPETVYEFGYEEPEQVHFPDSEVPEARIWGQSYRDRHESRTMYRMFTPADSRIPNIGILHTSLNPDGNRYVPVSRGKLEEKDDIHYWALGHIHDARVHDNEQPITYPGVPQGRQITEPGLGGGFLVELDVDGDYDIEFVPTSPVVWQTIEVDIGNESVTSIPDIQRKIEDAAEVLSATTDRFDGTSVTVRDPDWDVDGFVVRWRLTGHGPAHETLSQDEEAVHELTDRVRDLLASRRPFVWTESIRDETGPPVPSIDELGGEDRVIDEYLNLTDDFDREDARMVLEDTADFWESVEDHEDVQPDELPLTDDRLDGLVDRARERVLTELALRRTA